MGSQQDHRILDELGVLDRIELVQLPEVHRLKTPDLDIAVPQRDPEPYIALLSGHFRDEEDGVRGFVQHMVDLANEGDRFDGSKEVDGHRTHVSTGAGPEAEHEASWSGDHEHTGFSVTVYDNAFEGYSRPGTSTVMPFTQCGWEPWRKFEDDYARDDRAAYGEEKERWSESLIRRAEELVIPGLSSMIEVKVTASPLTDRAFTGNTEGAIYGFEQSMGNAFMTRIQNGTPVTGPHLAGAWGNPGGGSGGALDGGEAAFRALTGSWAQG